jgi:murein DD-endopeptidase MepM/ murein hydrolase activator NlpD
MNTLIFPNYSNIEWKKIIFTNNLLENNIQNFTYGGFLEDISKILYKFDKTMIHLGIDINIYEGTKVSVPIDCKIINIYNDISNENGWGFRILFELIESYKNAKYMIYGHLAYNKDLYIGQICKKGDIIGVIGNYNENGGWFPHLHVQLMTNNFIKFYYNEENNINYLDEIDGYSHDKN